MIEFEAEGDYWLMQKAGMYECIEESVLTDGIEIDEKIEQGYDVILDYKRSNPTRLVD